jgi:ATP-dependent Clp protease ATP-binding subunit ClpA
MNIYQIYVPELGTYVKYKVLEPEEAKILLDEIDNKPPKEYRKAILESVIFNIKTDVAESLRMMSRGAAEKCLEALYYGCIMLNPGLDIDQWIDLAYLEKPNALKKSPKVNTKNDMPDLTDLPPELEDFFNKTFKKESTQWQKIKPKKLSREKFLGLEAHLKDNIIGQDQSIETIVSALKRSQVGLNDTNRPLGVFLFAGASGVGKTHLANTLHKYIFGSENSLVRIDCGEFQHKHENQKLIGSPPGYIGHEEGGQLVNLVRKYPSTVVLLDEVEKAHQDLWNTFLRVFDDGMLTDNKGKSVSFRNTIIIMTTNLGNDKISDDLLKTSAGFTGRVDFSSKTKEIPKKDIVEKNTLEAVRKHFKPEFLNRLDKILVFNHLSRENLVGIAELEMSVVKNKLLTKGYSVIYTDSVIDAMLDKGIDSVKGARGLSQIRREMIEDKVADIIINTPPPRGTIFHLNYEDDLVLNLNKPKKERKNDVKEQ